MAKPKNTFLADRVRLTPHYQRAIRLDVDADREDALQSYILNPTSIQALADLSRFVAEGIQCAFTWTGPYGAGKSSLAVYLAALTSDNEVLRRRAHKMLPTSEAGKLIKKAFRPQGGWLTIAITGDRRPIVELLNDGIRSVYSMSGPRPSSIERVIERIEAISEDLDCRVLIIIDEFGKVLESSLSEGRDIYEFQVLAERLSRSRSSPILIGVLHQSFEHYAARMAQDVRSEWAKVQGRFVDLNLKTSSDEVISLAARAITIDYEAPIAVQKAAGVYRLLKEIRPNLDPSLEKNLAACWPLHPVSILFLSSLTRKAFTQSQRSLFGFLSSSEPSGFRDFLEHSPFSAALCFSPEHVFDYIKTNFDQALSRSPDSRRWANIQESLGRVEGRFSAGHVALFKTIALFDLLKEPTALTASNETLKTIFDYSPEQLQSELKDLASASVIVFRRYLDSWALFAGSDFNLEAVLSEEVARIDGRSKSLPAVLDLPPVVAKLHISRTGTLRWIERTVVDASNWRSALSDLESDTAVAVAAALVATSSDVLRRECSDLILALPSEKPGKSPVVWGLPNSPVAIRLALSVGNLIIEVAALELMSHERPELESDDVARREVKDRLESQRLKLQADYEMLCDQVEWVCPSIGLSPSSASSISQLASVLSDLVFPMTVPVNSELLNRDSPSGSASKATRELMCSMLEAEKEERLGLTGWAAEAGIYESLLRGTDHHIRVGDIWQFQCRTDRNDPFGHLWQVTDNFLMREKAVPLTALYDVWRSPPIGMKRGVMPLLAWLYMLSRKSEVVLYLDGVFQPSLLPINAEELLRRPKEFSLRYIQVSDEEKRLLDVLAQQFASRAGRPIPDDPLSVARIVVEQFRRLPTWTKRTMLVPAEVRSLRAQVLKASDPNHLLFVLLPEIVGSSDPYVISQALLDGLNKLDLRVEQLVSEIWDGFMQALDVNAPSQYLAIKSLMLRMDGFPSELPSSGLMQFRQRLNSLDLEEDDLSPQLFSLICAAANKTERDFVDHDIGIAKARLDEWALDFRKIELHQHLSTRSRVRAALTLGVGLPGLTSKLMNVDVDFQCVQEQTPRAREISKSLDGLKRSEKIAVLVRLASLLEEEAENE